jgi:SAM-dependent methyltransferase
MTVCPWCHGSFFEDDNTLRCQECGRSYGKNSDGFFELITDPAAYEKAATTHEYAEDQSSNSTRLWTDFFKPLLSRRPCERLLDVGCGVGKMVNLARQDSYDAYGVDLPALSPFWSQAGNDPQHFFACDAGHLPFPDDFFDVVWSLGVLEHIGTTTGHCTLGANYLEARQHYADEILRVTKPGGRIIIACPNKHFPVDIQHGPSDTLTPPSRSAGIRNRIFERTGVNLHRVAGSYHLASYPEVKALFCKDGRVGRFQPLPLKNYFAFGRFQSGVLRSVATIARFYVNNLPGVLRQTFLNPYVLVLIEKE